MILIRKFATLDIKIEPVYIKIIVDLDTTHN